MSQANRVHHTRFPMFCHTMCPARRVQSPASEHAQVLLEGSGDPDWQPCWSRISICSCKRTGKHMWCSTKTTLLLVWLNHLYVCLQWSTPVCIVPFTYSTHITLLLFSKLLCADTKRQVIELQGQLAALRHQLEEFQYSEGKITQHHNESFEKAVKRAYKWDPYQFPNVAALLPGRGCPPETSHAWSRSAKISILAQKSLYLCWPLLVCHLIWPVSDFNLVDCSMPTIVQLMTHYTL